MAKNDAVSNRPSPDVTRAYFEQADCRRFRWMTQHPYLSVKEKELLTLISALRPARLLEVGSGEGSNLVNLEFRPTLAVGVDLFEDRCHFARAHCSDVHFICADGFRLPIRSGSFDVVFCRDLLHHIEDKEALAAEMTRVCRPSGHVIAIEAHGRNPVILCLAAAIRAERGLLRNSPSQLRAVFVACGLTDVTVHPYQPLPIHRILLHPRYGFPSLGTRTWYQAMNNAFDALAQHLIPKRWWAYNIIVGRKTSTSASGP